MTQESRNAWTNSSLVDKLREPKTINTQTPKSAPCLSELNEDEQLEIALTLSLMPEEDKRNEMDKYDENMNNDYLLAQILQSIEMEDSHNKDRNLDVRMDTLIHEKVRVDGHSSANTGELGLSNEWEEAERYQSQLSFQLQSNPAMLKSFHRHDPLLSALDCTNKILEDVTQSGDLERSGILIDKRTGKNIENQLRQSDHNQSKKKRNKKTKGL